MMIRIHGSGVELNGRFRASIESRLQRVLERYGRHLQAVDLQIADVNGPKGGADKRARCIVQLARRGTVVVEVHSADTRSVIDLLVQRVGQSIGRRIGRTRSGPRSGRQRERERRLFRELESAA